MIGKLVKKGKSKADRYADWIESQVKWYSSHKVCAVEEDEDISPTPRHLIHHEGVIRPDYDNVGDGLKIRHDMFDDAYNDIDFNFN